MTRVLLYTDQPVLAKGFAAIMSSVAEFDLIGVCYASALLAETLASTKPDIALIDLNEEITLEGLADARRRAPNVRIVLWVRAIPLELAYQTIRLGVHGILRKTLSPDVMIKCLQRVAAGEYWFEEALGARLEDAEVVPLSRREAQLVNLLAQGYKNKEIAYALGISEGTIKVYLSRLYRKVGVKDRYELALYGLRSGDLAQMGYAHPAQPRRGPQAESKAPVLVLERAGGRAG
ncbi:MAG: response regulator transcription factor [Bryobacterales bacterium]|nr:response regulator transcription factor [Bryobacteraceae bacterium]MDW8131004.1 response regulator transcription factor [Bryobacterales bacterium]